MVGNPVQNAWYTNTRRRCSRLSVGAAVLLWEATALGEPAVTELYPALMLDPPTSDQGSPFTAALLDVGLFAIPGVALLGAALTMEPDRTGRPNTAHAYNPSADRVSDFTAVYAPIFLGGGTLLLDGFRLDWEPESYNSTIVVAEAVGLSVALNQVLKRASGRCRPVAVVEENGKFVSCDPSQAPAGFDGNDAYLSWPSGHVSGVAAATGAYLGLAAKTTYLGSPVWQYWLAGGVGTALTAATAALRVETGAHSWEDTLGSAAISVPLGLAVAILHPVASRPHREVGEFEAQLTGNANGVMLGGSF